jgi:hypothetical protein
MDQLAQMPQGLLWFLRKQALLGPLDISLGADRRCHSETAPSGPVDRLHRQIMAATMPGECNQERIRGGVV